MVTYLYFVDSESFSSMNYPLGTARHGTARARAHRHDIGTGTGTGTGTSARARARAQKKSPVPVGTGENFCGGLAPTVLI